MHSKNSFHLSRLRSGIKPFRLHWFATVGSTNDHAAKLRRDGGLYAPAIVLTGRQTAGRGRGSNTWWSSPGVLTVTFVLPIEEHLAPHQLPLIAGLAVRNAAAEISGSADIQLKWPNDLLFADRKLAGLLCERAQKVDLIGLGLNVNLAPTSAPPALRGKVTSLRVIAGQTLDITDALIAVARHLHAALSRRGEQPFSQMLREYDAHHTLPGRRVAIVDAGADGKISGRCEGLDAMGRLLVRQGNKLHHLIAGHVQILD